MAWYTESLDEETRGFIENKGFAKETPLESFTTLLHSYREAEKKIGIPADRVLRMPEPEDAAGWKAVRERLGTPATPEGYDFSAVKHADGGDVDADFITFLRETAGATGITKDAAKQIAAAFVGREEKIKASEGVKESAEIALAHQALDNAWGINKEANQAMADKAVALLGLTPEFINAASTQTSYALVMEGLRKIGAATSEAPLLGNAGLGGGNRVMTRDQAVARKLEITTDPTWVARWRTGDKAAVAELSNLDRLLVGSRP